MGDPVVVRDPDSARALEPGASKSGRGSECESSGMANQSDSRPAPVCPVVGYFRCKDLTVACENVERIAPARRLAMTSTPVKVGIQGGNSSRCCST